MADITNPQIVRFCNERLRPLADEIVRLKYVCDAFSTQYTQEGIAALVAAAGPANTVADGAATDGRPLITGNSVITSKTVVDQLLSAYAALVGGTGKTLFEIASVIQVNGAPK